MKRTKGSGGGGWRGRNRLGTPYNMLVLVLSALTPTRTAAADSATSYPSDCLVRYISHNTTSTNYTFTDNGTLTLGLLTPNLDQGLLGIHFTIYNSSQDPLLTAKVDLVSKKSVQCNNVSRDKTVNYDYKEPFSWQHVKVTVDDEGLSFNGSLVCSGQLSEAHHLTITPTRMENNDTGGVHVVANCHGCPVYSGDTIRNYKYGHLKLGESKPTPAGEGSWYYVNEFGGPVFLQVLHTTKGQKASTATVLANITVPSTQVNTWDQLWWQFSEQNESVAVLMLGRFAKAFIYNSSYDYYVKPMNCGAMWMIGCGSVPKGPACPQDAAAEERHTSNLQLWVFSVLDCVLLVVLVGYCIARSRKRPSKRPNTPNQDLSSTHTPNQDPSSTHTLNQDPSSTHTPDKDPSSTHTPRMDCRPRCRTPPQGDETPSQLNNPQEAKMIPFSDFIKSSKAKNIAEMIPLSNLKTASAPTTATMVPLHQLHSRSNTSDTLAASSSNINTTTATRVSPCLPHPPNYIPPQPPLTRASLLAPSSHSEMQDHHYDYVDRETLLWQLQQQP